MRIYIEGLITAAAAATGTAAMAYLETPGKFNPLIEADWKNLLVACSVPVVIAVAAYLKTPATLKSIPTQSSKQ